MLHNRDCCLGNDKTPPLHTHPLTHTHVHTQILLRQQDILRPHDLTGWFNVCSYARLMRWPPSDVLELFLLRDILPPSPQRWSTTVQFDEQIKHSPHFTSFTQTIPLFMAALQSRASKTKQKKVTWALVHVAEHNVHVVSVGQALLLCAGVQAQGRCEGCSAKEPQHSAPPQTFTHHLTVCQTRLCSMRVK